MDQRASAGVKAAVMGAIMMIIATAASAQTKSAGTKPVTHDITVKADAVYTGTIDIAIDGGKVTGDLNVTSPTSIVGKVAGTSKAGVLNLDFPYRMTERNCTGTVKMTITLPARPGPATGTMEAGGCGREDGSKVTGTVEITPASVNKK
jgi:hypothetical protein